MPNDTLELVGLTGRVVRNVLREKVGPKVRLNSPEDVPPNVQSLTPDWLTSVICRDVPGARVTRITIDQTTSATSVRSALTLEYNEAGQAADLPRQLFAKTTASVFSRILLGVTAIADGEASFYTAMRPSLTLRSPRAFYAGFDPKTYRSMALLEDLGKAGWAFPDPLKNTVTRQDAEDMVDQMANYHAAFWGSPRFATDLARVRNALPWQENLNRKVGFAKRSMTGFGRAEEVIPPRLFSRRREVYPALMKSLELHRAGPHTLLHQDVHLGNWLRDPEGRMGLYDWQCVAHGLWASDFSYALGGSLATEDRRAWENDLLRRYLDKLGEFGAKDVPSFEEAHLAYRQQIWHGLIFGVFTLGGSRIEPELQPKDYTLSAIKRLSQSAEDLESIDALR